MWKARPLDVSHVKLAKKDEWLRLRTPWTITSNHPCWKAVAARIALGEPKCHRQRSDGARERERERVKLHRDLPKWQCTPSNVLLWSFKITIVLKQFVITEAFYDHLMPWNLPNSNESWKSKRLEFHGIQILGFPVFVDAIQAPYSHCRLQIPGTKCPDSCRFLCRMSFNWICLMPSWTQNLQIQVQHEMIAQGLCRDPSCSSQAIATIQIAFRWLWVKFPNSTFQIQKHPNHLNCSVQSRRVPRPIPFRCMICIITYIHILNWKQAKQKPKYRWRQFAFKAASRCWKHWKRSESKETARNPKIQETLRNQKGYNRNRNDQESCLKTAEVTFHFAPLTIAA